MIEQPAVERAPARAAAPGTGVFDRIVCGVDGSEAARVAATQAAALLAPGGELTFVAAVEPVPVWPHEHAGSARVVEAHERAARAVAEARHGRSGAQARVEVGPASELLLREAEETKATLLALGSHGIGRGLGIALGSTVTTVLHEAPCSVLVARPTTSRAVFPRSITVGTDGSRHAAVAIAVARQLSARFDPWLRFVVATGGEPVDLDGLAHGPRLEWSERPPVEALVDAGRSSDLLVVGSRGLHGFRALGSVSERVAHEAPCSVLVVRAPPG